MNDYASTQKPSQKGITPTYTGLARQGKSVISPEAKLAISRFKQAPGILVPAQFEDVTDRPFEATHRGLGDHFWSVRPRGFILNRPDSSNLRRTVIADTPTRSARVGMSLTPSDQRLRT